MAANSISQWIGRSIGTLSGWGVRIAEPPPAKCVIIGAYHTSAWDLAATLLLKSVTALPIRFVIKSSLVRPPLGWVLERLGAIPLDRSTSQDFVKQLVAGFDSHDTFMVALSPEGTRMHRGYWRTGFYYTALTAEVPIVLAYADYRRKEVGLGPLLWPSGDIAADFAVIRGFYANVSGKYPEKQGPIRLRSSAAAVDGE